MLVAEREQIIGKQFFNQSLALLAVFMAGGLLAKRTVFIFDEHLRHVDSCWVVQVASHSTHTRV